MADVAAARREAFGARVRSLRLGRGWSQEDLAEAAGMRRTYIGSLERGQRNVSLDNIWRLAEVFEVTPGELLPEAPRRRR